MRLAIRCAASNRLPPTAGIGTTTVTVAQNGRRPTTQVRWCGEDDDLEAGKC